jgi:hypothetical protein
VEALHALGIVHGGIHGRNVILQPDGDVKLTHVSPLLYHEEIVDVEALKEMMGEMGFDSAGERASLKDLVALISPKEFQIDETGTTPEGEHLRRWALIGAIVAAAIGAGVAWMMWKNGVNQPAREAARATEYSCPCHPKLSTTALAASCQWHKQANALSCRTLPHPSPLPVGEGTGADGEGTGRGLL